MELHCMDRSPRATTAILLYGGKYNESGFVTVHPVATENGVPVIKPGTPATRQGLAEALREVADDAVPPELFPAHILAKGADHLVWYRPPSRQKVWVRSNELGGERNAEVPVPGLIWLALPARGNCRVFAYKGSDRPDTETVLHQAPFFNVWDSGEVCTGSADIPQGPAALVPENWEAMFFNSWFSHPNTPRLTKGKEGAYVLWERLLSGKHRVFPQTKLYSIKKQLGDVFNDMFKQA